MREFFGFAYAYVVVIGGAVFLWGIGSGMMNGIRYSSLGPCLVVTGICAAIAWGCTFFI